MISRFVRPRFGLRGLLIVVVVAALVLGDWELARRRNHYRQTAIMHEFLEVEELLSVGHEHGGLAAYHASLRKKYERAARAPWLSVEPDPPPPVDPRIGNE